MLVAYSPEQGGLRPGQPVGAGEAIPAGAVWLDLHDPAPEEARRVGEALGIEMPSREEMQEIEVSSRLYHEDGAHFMTATILFRADADLPETTSVTFILKGARLVTLRYADPTPFRRFAARASRPNDGHTTADLVLLGLLEAIVDRAADVLEQVGASVDAISHEIFQPPGKRPRAHDYREIIIRIGRRGDLATKARESLVSIGRLVAFYAQALAARKDAKDERAWTKTLARDAGSLADHASFLSSKIGFLLDASMGMINIEQSGIIKIFSVAAVVFLPPTLVASIYGMNFEVMPELAWPFGYPFALALMVGSALLPYWFFRRKGWL